MYYVCSNQYGVSYIITYRIFIPIKLHFSVVPSIKNLGAFGVSYGLVLETRCQCTGTLHAPSLFNMQHPFWHPIWHGQSLWKARTWNFCNNYPFFQLPISFTLIFLAYITWEAINKCEYISYQSQYETTQSYAKMRLYDYASVRFVLLNTKPEDCNWPTHSSICHFCCWAFSFIFRWVCEFIHRDLTLLGCIESLSLITLMSRVGGSDYWGE